MIKDMVDRELAVDDLVIYYGNIYVVKKAPPDDHKYQYPTITIKLLDASPSTISKIVNPVDVCLIPKEHATMWLLSRKSKLR